MSEEEKELLARIGQLAGQINRHKNQHSGGNQQGNDHHSHSRYSSYRPSRGSYPSRGRVSKQPAAHRHRTLHLNAGASSDSATSHEDGAAKSSWVSKNDRHRQLINADVYKKDAENRTKAIEQTRKRKIDGKRRAEKARFQDFLRNQGGNPGSSTNHTNHTNNEIAIEGIKFRVVDGGKKLVKSSDDLNASATTPKIATIAGVKFHRTKTGNLVADRIVSDHRRSGVSKLSQPCKIFSTTGIFHSNTWKPERDPHALQGSCPKGPQCRYTHDPIKVALCKDYLKDGKCPSGDSCDLSHDMTPERVPNCLHYAKGNCTKPDCQFTHSKASPTAPVCNSFGFYGYCEAGADCTERHVFECPDFSNTGKCKNKRCKLPHRERASVLRNQAKAEENGDDLSSDDSSVDSDDVDSDEVAEFLDADSDDESDAENQMDFIRV